MNGIEKEEKGERRDGEKARRREGGKEGRREGGKEGRREGGKEGKKEKHSVLTGFQVINLQSRKTYSKNRVLIKKNNQTKSIKKIKS